MKKSIMLVVAAVLFSAISVSSQSKLISNKTHIKFFSTTPAENIEAHNTASVSSIDISTGEVVFSVPMQGFEFEKALMQKHFNNDKFLDTKVHPTAKLKGKITNISAIDFSKDGAYAANIEGELTIKGVTKVIKEKGTVKVSGKTIDVDSKFNITLADYGVTFVKGKPASNIAKTVEVTVQANYQPE
jgi:polyisoprenoid-binding protein YceI